jgi:2-hydroxychromene-2-carboxylate isomerase
VRSVEYWYDISCPYAYLGSTQIEALAARSGAAVRWEPFLLGGLFRALGVPADLSHSIPLAKQRMNELDLHRWAAHLDVPLRTPADHPRSPVLALRALLAAGAEARPRVTHALYRAYWVDGRDLREEAVLQDVLDGAGVDGAACVEGASEPAIKEALWARTREAERRGVFGAPAIFVGDALFWGQDRLHFVEAALAGA